MTASEKLISHILRQEDLVMEYQNKLTSIPALSPVYGGEGEWKKSRLVLDLLPQGKITEINVPDSAACNVLRPNIVAFYKGKQARTLWLFAHLDVVPSGDLSLWSSDPWLLRREGDYLYGRGTEDNQQAVVSMLILAKSLHDLGITPEYNLGLIFMADEETGSGYGLDWILRNHSSFFCPDDIFIVPDGGVPDADAIEIAEKAQLWLKFVVTGQQCHASCPQNGKNTFLAASELVLKLERLNKIFSQANSLFSPPVSTFVPTKHDKNVDAINIIPGRDVFYMDCRLLPGLSKEVVLEKIEEICKETELSRRIDINFEISRYQEASSVKDDAFGLQVLSEAIKKIYGKKPVLTGIGGASVAAFLRARGFPALVWSCLLNTCHQPDEHSSISATLKDAAVFASILMAGDCNGNA